MSRLSSASVSLAAAAAVPPNSRVRLYSPRPVQLLHCLVNDLCIHNVWFPSVPPPRGYFFLLPFTLVAFSAFAALNSFAASSSMFSMSSPRTSANWSTL
jgi:hypothetical protein